MNLLEKIVEHKFDEIATRKREIGVSSLHDAELFQRETISIIQALNRRPFFSIIAEIKRSSPSAGEMNMTIQPEQLARQYARHGASAISVLTDQRFFNGTLNDLKAVRQAVSVPLLRKEFIIDEYQIAEAKAFGADAILLIAGILETSQLDEYFEAARSYGLESLIEIYEEKELEKIDFDKMNLIGVNNRDLRTLEIDVNRTIRIAKHIPAGSTLVSESGIKSSADLKRLKDSGIHAALVGELFMISHDPGGVLSRMLQEVNS
jgi:indole-3-glycerol phosphate synthase